MQKIKLIGYSGCRLEIWERGGKPVVVKTAKDEAYGERLKKQHEKQRSFRHDSFRAPAVLDSHYNDEGLFEFTMEYVNGQTLAEYFKEATISSIEELARKFLDLVPEKVAQDPGAKKIFTEKIGSLREQLAEEKDGRLAGALEMLSAYGWEHCTSGECHGDMTLENIIWKDGDLYLIDFLDSFYDSWMIDIAKLLMDIECLWSYRHSDIDENLNLRLIIFKDLLRNKVLSLPEGNALLDTVYHMMLVHVIRIIPYAQDEGTRLYLLENVGRICAIINGS